jgi:hypothetical protein
VNYATDGKCHNSQMGTYNHECGKPAAWIGKTANGFRSGFCAECKETGHEARNVVRWETVEQAAAKAKTLSAFDALESADRRGRVDAKQGVRAAARAAL